MTRARAVLVVLLLVGCRDGTSVVVRIDQGDVVIPAQIAAVHLRVTNPELSATEATFDSQVLRLCAAGAATGCYTLPLSVTLRPGDAAPDALVRAEVTALDSDGNEVIHDAAEFHFDKGEHTSLDFYLSQACLASTCATSNQLCGRNGGCVTGTPTTTSTPDLATTPAQPVTRFAENASSDPNGPEATWVLPKPINAITNDLLIVAAGAGTPPAGWHVVTSVSSPQDVLAYRWIGESESIADYTFAGFAGDAGFWLYALYRGVSQVVVGGIEGTVNPFVFPSLDSPADAALLTTWIANGTSTPCSHNGIPSTFVTPFFTLDETKVGAGAAGERTYQCAEGSASSYGVQMLLVP